jgi:hypothetical protein
MFRARTLPSLLLGGTLLISACAPDPESVPEVPAEEVTRAVPELEAVHTVMAPMWHTAWPAGDTAAVREAVADFEPLIVALDTAELPGILQDEQARWDERKALLMGSFQSMQEAAEAGDHEALMAHAEALHMNYEGLVRIVRPLVPALDRFHQELYGLYHYYGPGYDLEKIRRSADAMAAVLPDLREVELPDRLADRQAEFDAAVARLAEETTALVAVLEDPERDEVDNAIDRVHTAYQDTESVFD